MGARGGGTRATQLSTRTKRWTATKQTGTAMGTLEVGNVAVCHLCLIAVSPAEELESECWLLVGLGEDGTQDTKPITVRLCAQDVTTRGVLPASRLFLADGGVTRGFGHAQGAANRFDRFTTERS